MSQSSAAVSSLARWMSPPPVSLTRTKYLAPPRLVSAALRSPSTSSLSLRVSVRCSYAASGVREDFSSVPIDVVAEVKAERIVVLGGSGFVGSAICKAAISQGIEVVSISRSGHSSDVGLWVDQVSWIKGDVFYLNWNEVLAGATAVVSTLGGFGSEEQMKKINGEANILAVDAAKDFVVFGLTS